MILTICMVMVLSISKCANDQQTSSFGLAVSDIVIWEGGKERERTKEECSNISKLGKIFIMKYIILKMRLFVV